MEATPDRLPYEGGRDRRFRTVHKRTITRAFAVTHPTGTGTTRLGL